MILVSIIVRTLNEERYLNELLESISSQDTGDFHYEVVIVDSGSTDGTLRIAKEYSARITYIKKQDFTFGRSLNIGCKYANGKYLVFISGHCIPKNEVWLKNLISPLIEGSCDYVYGRQIARDRTKFSESQVFEKYFPKVSSIPQKGFFCNNANSAISREAWEKFYFDESLTGLEDMFIAKQICQNGGNIGYVADSCVFHIHDETWTQIKTRYEREAIALQKIMPEIRISIYNLIHFVIVAVLEDMKAALRNKVLFRECLSIVLFRLFQYYGSYKGNRIHRQLSDQAKIKYFYPKIRSDV